MIIDGILFIIKGIINIILSPLEIINIGIDLVASVPVVGQFLGIIAYIIPWKNILPLIIITCAILNWKALLSIINFIWNWIPIGK